MSRRLSFPLPGEKYESLHSTSLYVIQVGMHNNQLSVWYEDEGKTNIVPVNDENCGWFCLIKKEDLV